MDGYADTKRTVERNKKEKKKKKKKKEQNRIYHLIPFVCVHGLFASERERGREGVEEREKGGEGGCFQEGFPLEICRVSLVSDAASGGSIQYGSCKIYLSVTTSTSVG